MKPLTFFVRFAFAIALWPSLVLATHSVQTNGPVSVQIVEDVWGSPEYCYPCFYEDTLLFARTLRVETETGSITALGIDFSGTFHQEDDGFSVERSRDTHFLFDEVVDSLDITVVIDDVSRLTSQFSGFDPFTKRDAAHLLFADAPSVRASYIADVTVDLGNGNTQVFRLSDDIIPGFVPEPDGQVVAAMGSIVLLGMLRRRRTNRSHKLAS